MSLDMNKQFLYLICYDGFMPMNLLLCSHHPFIVTVMVSGIATQNRLPCLKVVNSNGYFTFHLGSSYYQSVLRAIKVVFFFFFSPGIQAYTHFHISVKNMNCSLKRVEI